MPSYYLCFLAAEDSDPEYLRSYAKLQSRIIRAGEAPNGDRVEYNEGALELACAD